MPGEWTCVVKESGEGEPPWLALEYVDGNAPGPLRGRILAMELHPATTLEQAKNVCERLVFR
jgi:hypothetical protein